MHIRYGYKIEVVCDQPTPLITLLDVHPSGRADITEPDDMRVRSLADASPVAPMYSYIDKFGNICRRFVAPAGGVGLSASGVVHDSGFTDEVNTMARAVAPQDLPDETLIYLMGSRYCETDRMCELAWARFGAVPDGWARVQAVCDHVHQHIKFDYGSARATRTAFEAYEEQAGVCRDFAHVALTLCRCLNIPARYCTGFLGDIGVPPDANPGDFSGWFEAYLGGKWWTFDARHNEPRIGRILIAHGRDAADVPIINSFGAHSLSRFEVTTEEVTGARYPASSSARRERWGTMSAIGPGS